MVPVENLIDTELASLITTIESMQPLLWKVQIHRCSPFHGQLLLPPNTPNGPKLLCLLYRMVMERMRQLLSVCRTTMPTARLWRPKRRLNSAS